MSKRVFCANASRCTRTKYANHILISSGCPDHEGCNSFAPSGSYVKDGVIKNDFYCDSDRCVRESIEGSVVSECIDCRKLRICPKNIRGTLRKGYIEFPTRCANGICDKGQSAMNIFCLDCDKSRVFVENRSAWLTFNGK